jgi:hypothetical protein
MHLTALHHWLAYHTLGCHLAVGSAAASGSMPRPQQLLCYTYAKANSCKHPHVPLYSLTAGLALWSHIGMPLGRGLSCS